MKNILYASLILLLSACGGGAVSSEPASEKRSDKLGNIVLVNAKAESYAFFVNDEELTEAKMPYGSSIVLALNNVSGFKEEKGKILCDAGIKIYNTSNEEIVSLNDLFASKYPEGMALEIFNGSIELKLKCQTPLKLNGSYKVDFILYDKRSDAKVTVSEVFIMVPTRGLTYKEDGLTSDGPFFMVNSASSAISVNKLRINDTVTAYFSGLSGLTTLDSLVKPDASIQLCNEFEDIIAEFPNLYKAYEKTGVSANLVNELVTLEIILPPTLVYGRPYSIKFHLGDKQGKAQLNARYDFIVK